MKAPFFLPIIVLIAFSACDNSSNSKENTPKVDSAISPTINQSKLSVDTARKFETTFPDSSVTINFPELSLNINRFVLFEDSISNKYVDSDTAYLTADLGEILEGQIISVHSDNLIDLKLEERYETSVTIQNEGPHCDLTEWKHYDSEWKPLPKNKNGQFTCLSYTEDERQKFLNVSIEELKQAVAKHCGVAWSNRIENVNSPTDYPSAVGVSHYFLRLTGKQKSSKKDIEKLIVIEILMGC